MTALNVVYLWIFSQRLFPIYKLLDAFNLFCSVQRFYNGVLEFQAVELELSYMLRKEKQDMVLLTLALDDQSTIKAGSEGYGT